MVRVTVGASAGRSGDRRGPALVHWLPHLPAHDPDRPRTAPRCRRGCHPLAHHEGHGPLAPVEGHGLAHTVAAAGTAQGPADVLLVGPGVEDPGLHELPVGNLADRAPPHLIELRPRAWPEGLEPSVGGLRRTRPAPRRPGTRPAGRRPTPRSTRRRRCGHGRGPRSSGGGGGSPSNSRSMPMRWESWSLTVHPGQSVGRSHWAALTCSQASTSDTHTSVMWSTTASLLAGARMGSPSSIASTAGGPAVEVAGRPSGQPGRLASMASITSGASGSTMGRNRCTISPVGDTRNFSKFHWMSPASPSASGNGDQLLVDRDGGRRR